MLYTFRLTPSRQKSNIQFTMFIPEFLEAVNCINNGLAFKRDNKHLILEANNIAEKEITILLSTPHHLENPNRSLSSITRYLTTYHSEKFREYIYNKTLFNIELISCENDVFSSEELLKKMIDFLYCYPNTPEKELAISDIQNILYKFT